MMHHYSQNQPDYNQPVYYYPVYSQNQPVYYQSGWCNYYRLSRRRRKNKAAGFPIPKQTEAQAAVGCCSTGRQSGERQGYHDHVSRFFRWVLILT